MSGVVGYVLVSNIPPGFHTADIRRYFADHVEKEKFTCFHYRHRTERKNTDNEDQLATDSEGKTLDKIPSSSGQSFQRQVTSRVHVPRSESPPARPTCCCVVQLLARDVDAFLGSYHRKHWLDSEDNELASRCLLAKISKTDESELSGLPELRPPNIMPRGNVGTSTNFFLDAIRDCRLPSKLIGKLRLEFPKGKHQKYAQVPFQYGRRAGSHPKLVSVDRQKLQALDTAGPVYEAAKDDSDADDDDDTCEEWERHEALHNDVQANRTIGRQVNSSSYLAAGGDLDQQPGTKEKPFESEIELVWEKGGSGLNFYTDAQFWKAQEGTDFDEQTTDDWDVDMSVHYEKNSQFNQHDKDAVDRFDMRRSEFLRSDRHQDSVFRKVATEPTPMKMRSAWASSPPSPPSPPSRPSPTFTFSAARKERKRPFGHFEEHTTGFGGRMLRSAGWKEGMGLGASGSGIKHPIDALEEGQGARDKKGVGYSGADKLVFARHRITSAYTPAGARDPPERLERSNPPLYDKFREQPVKFYSAGTIGGEDRTVVGAERMSRDDRSELEACSDGNVDGHNLTHDDDKADA